LRMSLGSGVAAHSLNSLQMAIFSH